MAKRVRLGGPRGAAWAVGWPDSWGCRILPPFMEDRKEDEGKINPGLRCSALSCALKWSVECLALLRTGYRWREYEHKTGLVDPGDGEKGHD
jgi:hypothetical protein